MLFFKRTPKKVMIKIDHPCSEEWDEMSPSDRGKFCSQCSKEVIDFSQKSNNEIIRLMSKQSGLSCGRFTEDQINTLISIPPSHRKTGIIGWVLSALTLFTSFNSQSNIRKRPSSSIIKPTGTYTKLAISGTVVGNEGPMSGITIDCASQDIWTISDTLGKFEIEIPKSLLDTSLTFIIRAKTYHDKKLIITPKDYLDSALEIKLEKNEDLIQSEPININMPIPRVHIMGLFDYTFYDPIDLDEDTIPMNAEQLRLKKQFNEFVKKNYPDKLKENSD